MTVTGVVCGRFQIFHKEHLQYILAAKEKCSHLLIGITLPDGPDRDSKPVPGHREHPEANPCTFYERMSVIKNVMLECGLGREEFDIVPYPIEKPERLFNYVPKGLPHFITILDEWGEQKKLRIESAGYPVTILWRDRKKNISSTMIRHAIQNNAEWKQYVPEATYQYFVSHKLDERIRRIGESDHLLSQK